MKKINFCIVIYNKDLSESQSLNSLLQYFEKNKSLGDIVVFNNGPHKIIKPKNTSDLVILNQVMINGSLSKIYNKFIDEYKADFHVFLDDDTYLTTQYLDELSHNTADIIFPRVYCEEIEFYPIFKKNNIQSITSGLCLSSKICEYIQSKYTTVFDERLDLYGIDTAFCYRVNKDKLLYEVSDSYINHDLSHITSNNNSFREAEVLLANSASLIHYFNFKLLFVVIYGQLKTIKRCNFSILISSIFSIILGRTFRIYKY